MLLTQGDKRHRLHKQTSRYILTVKQPPRCLQDLHTYYNILCHLRIVMMYARDTIYTQYTQHAHFYWRLWEPSEPRPSREPERCLWSGFLQRRGGRGPRSTRSPFASSPQSPSPVPAPVGGSSASESHLALQGTGRYQMVMMVMACASRAVLYLEPERRLDVALAQRHSAHAGHAAVLQPNVDTLPSVPQSY